VTPEALARATAERLRQAAHLNATLAWSEDDLLAQALRPHGGPLAGTAVAVKDNLVTASLPTTCASRILEGYRSPFEATVVRRLRAAGALIAAKTNMDEFAMGSSSEFSAYGPVLHPLDSSRVPGGSSGGSAALVGAGVVPAALGSETGGSVRQPAAFCGVVGMKPTYGRVSRYGLVAFGSSLDCVAVFGRDVATAATVLEAISGPDPRDATSRAEPPIHLASIPADLGEMTIGLPREYWPADLDPAIAAGVERAKACLEALGARVRWVELPHTRYAVPTYYVLAPAEAAANLARFDGVRYGQRRVSPTATIDDLYRATRGQGFGPEVRRRIVVGTYVLSAGYHDTYYGKAQLARSRIAADFDRVFNDGVDLLLTPTTPSPAFRLGEKVSDPVAMYLADTFVCAVSLAGLPAISLPIGRTEGLPVGVQLIGPAAGDERVLTVAAALERVVDPVAELR